MPPRKKVAFYITNLHGGGVQRITLQMAEEMQRRGYAVDLIVDHLEGPLIDQIAASINLVQLARGSKAWAITMLVARLPGSGLTLLRPKLKGYKIMLTLRHLTALKHYMQRERPAALVTTNQKRSIQAVWANRLAGGDTRVIITERIALSKVFEEHYAHGYQPRRKIDKIRMIRRIYPLAHAIVPVSDGVGHDLADMTGLDPALMRTIYNPVVSPKLLDDAHQRCGQPWLDEGTHTVILGTGRLSPEKGFITLIDAFAILEKTRAVRLVIFGEGKQRDELQHRVESLGLAESVALPGWIPNPIAAMSRASIFALSSLREGLPAVLIQAMACGCPVVSTDCPSGPREILENGRYGSLVTMNDPDALAAAIAQTLDKPPSSTCLRERASVFSVDAAMDRYQALIENDPA